MSKCRIYKVIPAILFCGVLTMLRVHFAFLPYTVNYTSKLVLLDVPFPVLLSTFVRSQFQTKPATLLTPINTPPPLYDGGLVLLTKVAPFP
jgi:hypothetical protein